MTSPGRPPDVSALTAAELERTRRELAASLALLRPGSPAQVPILAHLTAIDTEMAGRAAPGTRPALARILGHSRRPGTVSTGIVTACLRSPPAAQTRARAMRHDPHNPCRYRHAVHLLINVTVGTDEQDRGPAARRRAPCPVPAARGRCRVPLCAVLYPPPRHGTLAGQARGARPGTQGPGKGGPAPPGQRTAPRPCPAPHQAGHRPNNRPPLPPQSANPPRECAQEKEKPRPGKGERPGKTRQ